MPPTSLHGTSVSPRAASGQRSARASQTCVFAGKTQDREGFGAFQAALRESIMSIRAGAILHAGPTRSAGQHGLKDEHGAGGLGEEKRNANDVNDAGLWGCVYRYMRIPAR